MKRPSPEQVNELLSLCNRGQFRQALSQANALAEQLPDSSFLLNLQGAIHFGLGEPERAVAIYARALRIDPGSAQAHNNLGIALDRLGKREEAVASFERALQLKSDMPEAHNNLANALAHLGRHEDAVAHYTAALRVAPDNPQTHNNLGCALTRLGRFEEAIASYERARQIQPDLADAHIGLGDAQFRLGRLEEAAASYGRGLRLAPGDAEAHNNLGNALRRLGRPREALASFARALEIRPDFAQALSNSGLALDDLGRWDEAIASYTKALQIDPAYAEAHYNLGNVLDHRGRPQDAIASFDRAVRIKPGYAQAYNNRGMVLAFIGRIEEAVASYVKALEVRPAYAEAHRNLSALRRYEPQDPHIREMQELIDRAELSDEDRMHLGFALGKAYGDIGCHAKAFSCLSEGNRLRKQELEYDSSSTKERFASIVSTFSEELPMLDGIEKPGSKQERRVVFILGMPRSGTTLVEQILASHTQVYGAGELRFLEHSVNAIDWRLQPPSKDRLRSLRNAYFSSLDGIEASAAYITDKMPFNFWWIGFIFTAMPEAKVVHVKRDARATCWSNFKHFFPSRSVGFTNDFRDLAEYYRIYADLMAFWHERFSGRIYDLGYEALTENQEDETKKLLEYVGLDWEDACLDFYRTKRAVRTLSASQVRQSMFAGSSDDWRQYAAHLEPLVERLKGL